MLTGRTMRLIMEYLDTLVMARNIETSEEPHKLFDTLLVLDFGSQYVILNVFLS